MGKNKDLTASDVLGANYNPRTITDEERQGLKNSIKEFDNISGLTYNIRNKCLISGHRRWEELNADKRGISLVKMDKKDPKSVAWYMVYLGEEYSTFDLRVVDWDEKKEQAANVAANSHTIAGKFDIELLSTILDDMDKDYKDLLRINQLEVDLGINYEELFSDKPEVGDLDTSTSSMPANILIKCKEEDRKELVDMLKEWISDAGFEEVKING